ncbi:NfeD family protein [Waterburya agarophytonicola K14]|uniref:NfeD family protein n=1 Tax=Waterburya agarophytonicola KI4 TaxID=2874699 RepID=A0A964FGR9_9CYAN|nr:NfeD family protein [Waterburya agarophytonicola]MCC0176773.1 NfeD family protein [Waterburya agarophytonicola KI4]
MLDPTLFWTIIGGILCLMELIFPTAFVSFMMGVAALVVAVISLLLPQYTLLVGLWLILSISLTVLARRFLNSHRKSAITGDDVEAKAISGIPAGTTGRVLYEGNSWQAKCADETRDIAPNEAVYVIEKQGNTLIILPNKMLDRD